MLALTGHQDRARDTNVAFSLGTFLLSLSASTLCLLGVAGGARADQLSEELAGLASSDPTDVAAAIVKAANHGDARALPALRALDDGSLRFDATRRLLIKSHDGGLSYALSGAAATLGT